MPSPRVFISYSWHDDENRAWVQDFAEQLRSDNVEVTFGTGPGGEVTKHMETAVRDSDFVLMICTPDYKRRADERIGGVGYESDLVSSLRLHTRDRHRFIPILRSGTATTAIPLHLLPLARVDLTGDRWEGQEYRALLDALLHKETISPHPRPTPTESTMDVPAGPHQAVHVEGGGNTVYIAGRDLFGTSPQNAAVVDQVSGRNESNRGRGTLIGTSVVVVLVSLAVILPTATRRGGPSSDTQAPAGGKPPIRPPTPAAGGDTPARVQVPSGSGGGRAPAPGLYQREASRDSAAPHPPPASGAVPIPERGREAQPLEIDEVARTDGRSIFLNPRFFLPNACAGGARVMLNGTPGPSSIELGCTNGEFVFRPLDPPWKDSLNPNTLYCLSVALRGERPIRFPRNLAGADRVLTAEDYIGFRVDGDPENRRVILSNTPGRNGIMPCHM